MSKRPMGHGPLKNMRDFKAVAADYEYYLTLSDKPVSVCLTERQMYILSVWNTYTPWMTRWYNTEDTSAAELAIIAAEIEELLMCGCGVPQPTFTDYMNSISHTNTTSTAYTNTYNTWNTAGQTVASIAPDLDYSSGVPANIDKLSCLAVGILVDTILKQAIGIKEDAADEDQELTRGLTTALGSLSAAGGAAMLVGGVGATAVAFFGGPWMLLGLALGAVGTAIATLVISADTAALTDIEAKELVICTMQSNLMGTDMTQAAFAGSLSPNDFPPGGNAEVIAGIVQAYLSDLNTYLQFLVAAQGLYGVVDFGELPDCDPCGPAFCRLYNPANDLGTSFVAVTASQASYSAGGWGRGTVPSRISIRYVSDAVSRLIETITIVLDAPINTGNTKQIVLYKVVGATYTSLASVSSNTTSHTFTVNQTMASFAFDCISDSSVLPGATAITSKIIAVQVQFASSEPTDGTDCV